MTTDHAAVPSASAPVAILLQLPQSMQTAAVLRALICAELSGHQRCMCEGLGNIRLSSSRAS